MGSGKKIMSSRSTWAGDWINPAVPGDLTARATMHLAKRWRIPPSTPMNSSVNISKPRLELRPNRWVSSSRLCIGAWRPGNCSTVTKPAIPIVATGGILSRCIPMTITATFSRRRSSVKWIASLPAPKKWQKLTKPAHESNWSRPSFAICTALHRFTTCFAHTRSRPVGIYSML